MIPLLKNILAHFLVLLFLLQFIYGLEEEVNLEVDQSLEKEENSSQITKKFDWEKPSIDDIKLNYPEIKPGRPITVSLVIGVIFVTLTVTPFLVYALYLLLTPAPLRPNLRVKRSLRQQGQLFHYEPDSWYEQNDYNRISNELTRSECLEKILCRMGKRANDFGVESWLNSAVRSISYVRPSWRWRMHRGMSSAGGHCNFHCDPINSLLSDMKNLISLPSRNTETDSQQYLESSF
ncbi:unnamed protein product [Allacma fusca]|uniref:Uncharacterized protein n=1 Tax=Allacma fusca TaxID=39272 RepID=A0A8J2JAV6_9HEXA|nr:unnamed protein product [Allacma fusca]